MSKTPICQSQALLLEKLLVRTQKVSKPNKPMHENKSNPQSSLTYSPVSKMERAQLIGSEKSLLFVLLLLPPSFGFTNIKRCFHHYCVYIIWARQQSHVYVPCWVFSLMLPPDLCLCLSVSLFVCICATFRMNVSFPIAVFSIPSLLPEYRDFSIVFLMQERAGSEEQLRLSVEAKPPHIN